MGSPLGAPADGLSGVFYESCCVVAWRYPIGFTFVGCRLLTTLNVEQRRNERITRGTTRDSYAPR